MAEVKGNITASTVLPARRDAITLHSADGLRLVGELATPILHDPVATVICLHPLPTHGGSMDSHVLRKAAWRLPALADLAVLRFNTRGTASEEGRSEGEFAGGIAERYDVAAALDFVEHEDLPEPWLLGWSFGTDLVLMHGLDPAVVGAILLAPPLRYTQLTDLERWAESGKPLRLIVPEFDDYLRPAEAAERFSVIPQVEVCPVLGSKHLFVGHVEEALNLVVGAIREDLAPLAATWPPASPVA